jgi:pyruvate kinase
MEANSDTQSGLPQTKLLLEMMLNLREEVTAAADSQFDDWRGVIRADRQDFLKSAHNLAAYLSFRQFDLRELQDWLSPLGLSSLGRIESRVQVSLDAVTATLADISGVRDDRIPPHPTREKFADGYALLDRETERAFGKPPATRRVRMMVTLPTDAASSASMVREMVEAGMNIARINCAHDDPEVWAAMIERVRQAEKATGKKVRIAMDLGGPKVRTADVKIPKKHRVMRGDTILLTRAKPKRSKEFPVQARCTAETVFDTLQVGARVYFDDGKVGAVVREVSAGESALLEVASVSARGVKLKDDKGINFPGTPLNLSPLTAKDLRDLDFVVEHADIINYSFVQRVDDVRLLQQEIAARSKGRPIALVLKIETAESIQNLPDMIVEAAGMQPVGVMIARGDLAIEIGWERLAEMQEEIMWVCEAAHVPVIWATQVLEGLAKEGIPSRAEITDAAMSERAECVMLNKGPHILEAMRILDSVLVRMSAHQSKKTARLRALKSWKVDKRRGRPKKS